MLLPYVKNEQLWGCPSSTLPPTIHNGGANVAFCDGHSKWLNASAFEDASQLAILWQGGF